MNKQKLIIEVDNRLIVTRGEGKWRVCEMGKGA